MEQIARMRTQWFAQLEAAIEAAQRLAWQLASHQSTSEEARKLYGRLSEAKLQLDSLRGAGRAGIPEVEPDWLRKLGWKFSHSEIEQRP